MFTSKLVELHAVDCIYNTNSEMQFTGEFRQWSLLLTIMNTIIFVTQNYLISKRDVIFLSVGSLENHTCTYPNMMELLQSSTSIIGGGTKKILIFLKIFLPRCQHFRERTLDNFISNRKIYGN